MIQDQKFGIEIEMSGINRKQAADVLARYFGTSVQHIGGTYDKYQVKDGEGRCWQIVRDASIRTVRKVEGNLVPADRSYSVELVSPICVYGDIKTIQELIRKLRREGATTDQSTGVHVHVDASRFDTNSLRNLVNIMRSKEDLLYKALQIEETREIQYCKKVDEEFLQRLNHRKPRTQEELKQIWYNGNDGSRMHYHPSRYKGLNLHSVFQKGTVEFRLYNSTTHAGKIKTYIQLSLAIANQALTQKKASYTRTHSENEKYTFRTWLLRLGMIGEEFKTARMFLLEHLEGNIAWKDPARVNNLARDQPQNREETAVSVEQTENPETTTNTRTQELGGMTL